MHDPDTDTRRHVLGAMLCNSCEWQRVVVSGRGSAFSMCRKSAVDGRFRKYPSLPVMACDGFSSRAPVREKP